MTESERHREIGRAVYELNEKRRELACLNAKKKRIGEVIGRVNARLFDERPSSWSLERTENGFQFSKEYEKPEDILEWPDLNAIYDLLQGIESAQKDIKSLTEFLSEMGINLK